MSSACLIVKQTPFVLAPRSLPQMVDSRPAATESFTSLWRPWLEIRENAHSQRNRKSCPYSRANAPANLSADGKPQAFQHPVRLFWPRSKSYDYLYSDGEALLQNFPVQATISFYEDSDSEEEEEDTGEEEDWDRVSDLCLKTQMEHIVWT